MAGMRGTFILILAYIYWLELSSRQIVIADFGPWHEILNDFVLLARDDRSLSLEF